MEEFMNGIFNIVNQIQPYIYLAVAAALIVEGVMFIIPMQRCHEMAKQSILYVLLGCGIVILAESLARMMASAFGASF